MRGSDYGMWRVSLARIYDYVHFTALCFSHVEVRFDISVITELIRIDWGGATEVIYSWHGKGTENLQCHFWNRNLHALDVIRFREYELKLGAMPPSLKLKGCCRFTRVCMYKTA